MGYTRVISGTLLKNNRPFERSAEACFSIAGKHGGNDSAFTVTDDILSRHMMFIGGTGSGKTNAIYHVLKGIFDNFGKNDLMVVFDTKGDYYRQFGQSCDPVLVGSDCPVTGPDGVDTNRVVWNIFKEISVDGDDDARLRSNTREITNDIFRDKVRRNNSNPFFPNAARDLLSAVIVALLRRGSVKDLLDNHNLSVYLGNLTYEKAVALLKPFPDLKAVCTYLGDGKNDQGLGVMAEFHNQVRDTFDGMFAEKGDFSVRDFIRNGRGKVLFVEYDISKGSSMDHMYGLLFDLALKEALSRNSRDGRTYVVCDELKLLPGLNHLGNALNFGRGLGVRVIAGIQSIDQLYEDYGEHGGRNVVSGFSSVLSFHLNDEATRGFVSGRYGTNRIEDSSDFGREPEIRTGHVVEDWELAELEVGEAVIGLLDIPPFKFRFNRW